MSARPVMEAPSATPEPALSKMAIAALWYAAHGIPVAPLHWPKDGGCSCGKPDCASPAKHPFTAHGFHDATVDAEQVAAWWRAHPDANIGIVTGTVSGLLVVDCDPRNGGPEDRGELVQQFGPMPDTAEVLTGGGGRHIYFRYAGGRVPQTLAEGVDLKGDGGYVVAAPSLHPSGKRYAVDGVEGARAFLSIAEAPDWLRAYIAMPRPVASSERAPDGEKWHPGERNNKLTSIAGTMRRRGCSLEAIEAALLEENRLRCTPPLAAEEVERIAASVGRYEPAPAAAAPSAPEAMGDEEAGLVCPQWPDPPAAEAYHGLAGEIVRALQPRTEADPVALLIHVLIGFGNLVGRNPHYRVGGSNHHMNEAAICVGTTASARKGTAKADTFKLLEAVDPPWAENCIVGGLSSGEGLIWAVRDEIEKQEPIREKNKTISGYQTVIVDPGVTDKRLLIIEPEFAAVLRVSGREGNILSTAYRQAWEEGRLSVMNKNSPAKATDAHVSVIGHITRDELLMELTNTDRANGFANRNLWLCVQRSKYLPDGGDWGSFDPAPLIDRLKNAVDFARGVGEMLRDEEAKAIWDSVYRDLEGDRLGLFGAITNRASPHTLRLSCIYALLDRSAEVRRPHLEAALALWKYCEDSAAFIFGNNTGNPVTDRILKALGNTPEGMTGKDLHALFDRHRSAEEIAIALRLLAERGLVKSQKEQTGGRPTERWVTAAHGAKKANKANKAPKGEPEGELD